MKFKRRLVREKIGKREQEIAKQKAQLCWQKKKYGDPRRGQDLPGWIELTALTVSSICRSQQLSFSVGQSKKKGAGDVFWAPQ